MLKRCFHTGFPKNAKLALPICPPNQISTYQQPVWGNKVQEIQLKNKTISYENNEINRYSHNISSFYNNNTIFLPTSHNTPLKTLLRSCRNIQSKKYTDFIDSLNITDCFGVYNDNQFNRNKLYSLLQLSDSESEKNIINSAILGILSNSADSIYIANNYIKVSNKHLIVSNYPEKVSQREIERCRIVATALHFGHYPILLDKEYDFEGEANIKYIPAIITENNQKYQLCISYNSSRSSTKCIENINKYLEKLKLPLLLDISLKPKPELETLFYHQDTVLNFTSTEEQEFQSYNDFLQNYKKNGTCILVKDVLDDETILHKLFEQIIYVDKKDDLLCANMIVRKDGIVGSSRITNIIDILKYTYFLNFVHPSTGGGGAHKCCSNIMEKNETLYVHNWIDFCKSLNIEIDWEFVKGVRDETDRLFL